MAHLVCEAHGKRVLHFVNEKDVFCVYHRNTGDGSDAYCNSSDFSIGGDILASWKLLYAVEKYDFYCSKHFPVTRKLAI